MLILLLEEEATMPVLLLEMAGEFDEPDKQIFTFLWAEGADGSDGRVWLGVTPTPSDGPCPTKFCEFLLDLGES